MIIMVKHKDVMGYVPLFHKLDIVYAKLDGKGGFYKQPALAMAIVKDENDPSITFLVPMVAMKEERDIDIAHEDNIIGYDDWSQDVDWKKLAEKYEEGKVPQSQPPASTDKKKTRRLTRNLR
jgi:hypothetical protein